MIFKKRGTGAKLDSRTSAQKEKDYKFEEIVASAEPVNWVEKPYEAWRKFTIRDQNGSGSCFPAGTPVLMEDLTYKPIEKVHLGERVITHKGNIKEVTHLFSRKWQGTMFTIKPYGCESVTASPEHPFLVGNKWVKAKDLKEEDYITIPKVKQVVKDKTDLWFESDDDFLWLIGLFLAEGSIDEYSVAFSLHQDETGYTQRIMDIMGSLGANVSVIRKKDGKGMTVKVYGEIWANRFLEYGSKICDKKRLNKKFLTLSPEKQLNILKGWMDGDGSDRNPNRYVGVTTSHRLAQQMVDIAKRNDIRATIRRRKDREGRLPVWEVSMSRESITLFVNGKKIKASQNRYYKEDKDNFYVKIRSIEKVSSYAGGHIYNIEVEDDNTYIVNGIAVHNCVAQSMAKLAEVQHFVETGEILPFSAGYYKLRKNKPSAGMEGVDAFEIWRKFGIASESLLPSQKMTDFQMDNQPESSYANRVAEASAITNYVQLTEGSSFEDVASVIQKTGKGVMVWFYFNKYEWTDIPEIKDPKLNIRGAKTLRHSVTAVDYVLYQGKKYLVIEDSWGKFGKFAGQRLISEEFYKARNFFACYPMTFKTWSDSIEEMEDELSYRGEPFNKNLKFGDKSDEVKRLQDVLKIFSTFPKNVDSTGYYGAITARAVLDFQTTNGVPDSVEYEGKYFGPKTRKALNKIIQ